MARGQLFDSAHKKNYLIVASFHVVICWYPIVAFFGCRFSKGWLRQLEGGCVMSEFVKCRLASFPR